ncbi:hypothetical protein V3C99_003612 [Haemonchus contortus]
MECSTILRPSFLHKNPSIPQSEPYEAKIGG